MKKMQVIRLCLSGTLGSKQPKQNMFRPLLKLNQARNPHSLDIGRIDTCRGLGTCNSHLLYLFHSVNRMLIVDRLRTLGYSFEIK